MKSVPQQEPESSGISNGESVSAGTPFKLSNMLRCPKCGAEVPPTQIVCSCFAKNAQAERKQKILEGFFLRSAQIYLAKGSNVQRQRHLIPWEKDVSSLCGKHDYKRKPDSKTLTKWDYDKLGEMQICMDCIEALEKFRRELPA